MKPADFHRMAQKDLDEAVAYYERQRKGLGLELNTEVELAVSRILSNPEHFSRYKQSKFRKLVLRRFPFSIFFLELDTYIWIAAVAHQKRRPDYWRRRKPA